MAFFIRPCQIRQADTVQSTVQPTISYSTSLTCSYVHPLISHSHPCADRHSPVRSRAEKIKTKQQKKRRGTTTNGICSQTPAGLSEEPYELIPRKNGFPRITEETQSQNVIRIKTRLASLASMCFSKASDTPLPEPSGPQEWKFIGESMTRLIESRPCYGDHAQSRHRPARVVCLVCFCGTNQMAWLHDRTVQGVDRRARYSTDVTTRGVRCSLSVTPPGMGVALCLLPSPEGLSTTPVTCSPEVGFIRPRNHLLLSFLPVQHHLLRHLLSP